MTTRTVTGNIQDITGAVIPSGTFEILPITWLYGPDANSLTLANSLTVTAGGAGNVSFAIEEGSYLIKYQTIEGIKSAAITVDNVGPWTIGRLVGLAGPVAADLAQQVFTARDAAEAALDTFDDEYLGAKATAPTLDNDGNALQTGALYFNTTAGEMRVWNGTTWLVAYTSVSGALLATNNLSDIASAGTARTNLGLGTAATATAQTSTTDDTTGHALAVGAFGLGGSAISYLGSIDDNTLPSGFYFAESGSTGTKPIGSHGHLIVSRRTTGDRVTQRWVTDANIIYTRVYYASAWTAWVKVYNQGSILGAVSQVSGVPTGAIIERGSNANGEYVRLADSTQICTSPVLASGAVTTPSGALFQSASVTWMFPAGFITGFPPIVSGNGGNVGRWLSIAAPGLLSTFFRVTTAVSSATSTDVRLTAIGRWF